MPVLQFQLFKRIFLGLLFFIKAEAQTSAFILAAEQLKLADSVEWQRLNHYQKTFFGGWKSTIKGDFFLSTSGAVDPAAELRATLEQMFAGEPAQRQKTQCRYPARREWLMRKLQIPVMQATDCQLLQDWVKRLGAAEVSLIFASSFMNSAGSSFGHTFLKLNNPKNKGALELTDYGVNFSARTADADGALYAIKGLLGDFPGAFSMLPYHQLIKDYINLEGRDLWEFKLNLTATEVSRLLYALLEIDGAYFDYYFLDDNCSFQILKLLEVARPELNLMSADELFVIPLDTIKQVLRESNLLESVHYRPSMQTKFRFKLQKIERQEQQRLLAALSEGPVTLQRLSTANLDLLQDFLALKMTENRQAWQVPADQVARLRSRREPLLAEPLPVPTMPAEAPDSSSLSFGVFEKAGLQGQELELRMAFHSLLSRDEGAAKWSELEVLGIRLRHQNSTQNQREMSYIEELRILNMLSTSAVNFFFQPLSWGVKIGALQSGSEHQRLSPQFQIKAGTGLDLFSNDLTELRWVLLAKGSAQETPDLSLAPGLGGETLLLARLGTGVRLGATLEKLYYGSWESQSYGGQANIDLWRQGALELKYQELQWQGSKEQGARASSVQSDSVFRLSTYFLL